MRVNYFLGSLGELCNAWTILPSIHRPADRPQFGVSGGGCHSRKSARDFCPLCLWSAHEDDVGTGAFSEAPSAFPYVGAETRFARSTR